MFFKSVKFCTMLFVILSVVACLPGTKKSQVRQKTVDVQAIERSLATSMAQTMNNETARLQSYIDTLIAEGTSVEDVFAAVVDTENGTAFAPQQSDMFGVGLCNGGTRMFTYIRRTGQDENGIRTAKINGLGWLSDSSISQKIVGSVVEKNSSTSRILQYRMEANGNGNASGGFYTVVGAETGVPDDCLNVMTADIAAGSPIVFRDVVVSRNNELPAVGEGDNIVKEACGGGQNGFVYYRNEVNPDNLLFSTCVSDVSDIDVVVNVAQSNLTDWLSALVEGEGPSARKTVICKPDEDGGDPNCDVATENDLKRLVRCDELPINEQLVINPKVAPSILDLEELSGCRNVTSSTQADGTIIYSLSNCHRFEGQRATYYKPGHPRGRSTYFSVNNAWATNSGQNGWYRNPAEFVEETGCEIEFVEDEDEYTARYTARNCNPYENTTAKTVLGGVVSFENADLSCGLGWKGKISTRMDARKCEVMQIDAAGETIPDTSREIWSVYDFAAERAQCFKNNAYKDDTVQCPMGDGTMTLFRKAYIDLPLNDTGYPSGDAGRALWSYQHGDRSPESLQDLERSWVDNYGEKGKATGCDGSQSQCQLSSEVEQIIVIIDRSGSMMTHLSPPIPRVSNQPKCHTKGSKIFKPTVLDEACLVFDTVGPTYTNIKYGLTNDINNSDANRFLYRLGNMIIAQDFDIDRKYRMISELYSYYQELSPEVATLNELEEIWDNTPLFPVIDKIRSRQAYEAQLDLVVNMMGNIQSDLQPMIEDRVDLMSDAYKSNNVTAMQFDWIAQNIDLDVSGDDIGFPAYGAEHPCNEDFYDELGSCQVSIDTEGNPVSCQASCQGTCTYTTRTEDPYMTYLDIAQAALEDGILKEMKFGTVLHLYEFLDCECKDYSLLTGLCKELESANKCTGYATYRFNTLDGKPVFYREDGVTPVSDENHLGIRDQGNCHNSPNNTFGTNNNNNCNNPRSGGRNDAIAEYETFSDIIRRKDIPIRNAKDLIQPLRWSSGNILRGTEGAMTPLADVLENALTRTNLLTYVINPSKMRNVGGREINDSILRLIVLTDGEDTYGRSGDVCGSIRDKIRDDYPNMFVDVIALGDGARNECLKNTLGTVIIDNGLGVSREFPRGRYLHITDSFDAKAVLNNVMNGQDTWSGFVDDYVATRMCESIHNDSPDMLEPEVRPDPLLPKFILDPWEINESAVEYDGSCTAGGL